MLKEIALEISIFDGGLWKLLLLAELAKGDARHKRKWEGVYSSDLYSMVVYGSYTIESPSNRTGHRSKYIRSRNTSVQLTLWQVGLPEQVLTSTWCAWRTCTYHVVFLKTRIKIFRALVLVCSKFRRFEYLFEISTVSRSWWANERIIFLYDSPILQGVEL